jgi:hypothetical protein
LYEAKTKTSAIFSSIFTAFEVTKTPRVDTSELFTIYFPADHTGFDLMLDSIDIKFDSLGNPTICTRLANFCKTLDVTNPDTTPIVIPDAEVAGLKSLPFTLCSQAFDKLDISQLGTNTSLYSTGFFDSGLDATGYRNALQTFIQSNYPGISAAIQRPRFINVDSNGNYLFWVGIFNTNNNNYIFGKTVSLKKENDKCVMTGNQRPFSISVITKVASAVRVDDSNSSGAPITAGGLSIYASNIDDFGNKLDLPIDSDGLPLIKDSNGSYLPVKSLELSWCNTSNTCAPMNSLILGTYGYNDPSNNRLVAFFSSFKSVGIDSADTFYNGNPNPIQVRMLDGSGNELKKIRLPSPGHFFSPDEEKFIVLPSILNAKTLLANTSTANPTTFSVNVPPGVTLYSANLRLMTINTSLGIPNFGSGSSRTITSISTTLYPETQVSIDQSISDLPFRSINLNGNGPMRTPYPYSVVYFWSPTCPNCGSL